MKNLAPLLIAATLVLVGAGCSSASQPPAAPVGSQMTPPAQVNAYPGTEPYIAPTTPPPSQPK
jgi:hypothetical protein